MVKILKYWIFDEKKIFDLISAHLQKAWLKVKIISFHFPFPSYSENIGSESCGRIGSFVQRFGLGSKADGISYWKMTIK